MGASYLKDLHRINFSFFFKLLKNDLERSCSLPLSLSINVVNTLSLSNGSVVTFKENPGASKLYIFLKI